MPVGFFTEGVDFELPHPAIDERTILIVYNVFEFAWALLKKFPPMNFDMGTADEDTITRALIEIIEGCLRKKGEVAGFNAEAFGKTTRAPEVTNFNRMHPNKKPDILFDLKREHLSVRVEHDGLFVECKPVDADHPVYSCYCKQGLVRFVNGDYAWAMQQAMMLGYAREPYIFSKLKQELDNEKGKIPLNTQTHELIAGGKLYKSTHKRQFPWPDARGEASPIDVYHQWLPR